MLRTTIQTVILASVTALTIGAGEAQAASLVFSGPASGTAGTAFTTSLAVDPSNAVGDDRPVLSVKVLDGACPAGPGASTVPDSVSRQFPVADGPQTIAVTFNPSTAGRKHFCAWLDQNGTTTTPYAAAEQVVDFAAAAPYRGKPAITAAWGRIASGKCRVAGDVTPRGTGKVTLQRRAGSSWKTVKSIKITDTKYVTTFGASKGQKFRIRYAGSTTLLPGVSLTHKVTKRSKYEC